MNLPVKTNKSLSKIPTEDFSIHFSIEELVTESRALFEALDVVSNRIREIEDKLGASKCHFPFRRYIKSEDKSFTKPSEEPFSQLFLDAKGAYRQIHHYLAWELGEDNHKYRLFLLSIELGMAFGEHSNGVHEEVIYTKTIVKKPLIETDLPTRLKHSDHLTPFIDSFKDFIRNRRISIETIGLGLVPF